MRAVRMQVFVENGHITAMLPPDVPDGTAELVLIYNEPSQLDARGATARHLEALLERITARAPGRSQDDIDRQIAEERESWGA
jgi:hypothetical protein